MDLCIRLNADYASCRLSFININIKYTIVNFLMEYMGITLMQPNKYLSPIYVGSLCKQSCDLFSPRNIHC